MSRVCAALVAGLVGLTGCGAGDGPAPRAPEVTVDAAAYGLTARLVPHRDDLLRRVLSVKVLAGVPVQVRQVRLETAAFETPVAGSGADLRPGQAVDLRVPYGPARCGQAPRTGATALLVVGADDGRDRQVRLPLADGEAVFGRLRAAECAQRQVREQVELSLTGFAGPAGGDAVTGSLRVRRLAGGDPVRVTEIGRSTLLAPSAGPAGGPVLTLAPDQAEAQVAVEVRPARCDPHALAESKRSTAFRVFVSVAGAEPLLVLVDPPQADRDALVAFVTASCRRGT